jgi:surfactin synthase thioesterase subunit
VSTPGSSWFPPCRAAATPAPVLHADAVQLFCLPHAGAGALAYRAWPSLMAPGAEVIPVQLPGREGRHAEALRRSVPILAAELTGPIAARAGERFALFGHSMGALIGYELAHALCDRGRAPVHLFVSGMGAPHLPSFWRGAHRLPDEELLTLIAEMQGTSPEVVAQPELMQMLLPVLRADLEACDTYVAGRQRSLRVPITALGGRLDPGAGPEWLRAWAEYTSAGFQLELFDGGHFYLHTGLSELAGVLTAHLRQPGHHGPDGSRAPQTQVPS